MNEALGASGVTHVCLGNHEADIPANALADRINESSYTWVNSNMRTLDFHLGVSTLEYERIEIKSRSSSNSQQQQQHTRSIDLWGLLTEDSNLYRECAFNGAIQDAEPVIECAQRLLADHGSEVDLILPMTHQDLPFDRELAKLLPTDKVPLILGGHDHFVYYDDNDHDDDSETTTIEGTRIVKTGMDAQNIAVYDICWSDPSQKVADVSAEIISLDQFEPSKGIQNLIASHHEILKELEMAKLFRIEDPHLFSTKDNRYHPTLGSTKLMTVLRKGLQAECGFVNAGGIRGNKDYYFNDTQQQQQQQQSCEEESWFSFADLKEEFPFSDPFGVFMIPGRVLQDAITYSRRLSPQQEESGFLHTCDAIEYSDDKIISILGQGFEPDRLYSTACPLSLLNGMDNNRPLLKWKEEETKLPQHICDEIGKPVKVIFVEYFALTTWKELGSFEEIDTNNDGQITRDDVKAMFERKFGMASDIIVDDCMALADRDGDGIIYFVDFIAAKFRADLLHQCPCDRKQQKRPTVTLQERIATELDRRRSSITVEDLTKAVKGLAANSDSWHTSLKRGSLVSKKIFQLE